MRMTKVQQSTYDRTVELFNAYSKTPTEYLRAAIITHVTDRTRHDNALGNIRYESVGDVVCYRFDEGWDVVTKDEYRRRIGI